MRKDPNTKKEDRPKVKADELGFMWDGLDPDEEEEDRMFYYVPYESPTLKPE